MNATYDATLNKALNDYLEYEYIDDIKARLELYTYSYIYLYGTKKYDNKRKLLLL